MVQRSWDPQLVLTTRLSNKLVLTTSHALHAFEQSVLQKRKVRYVHEGISKFILDRVEDTSSPVLKAAVVRLLTVTAIAALHGRNIYKTDTKQAFVYGDLEDHD